VVSLEASRLIRRHWLFGAVLAAALCLRVLVEVTYWPALFYSDSWQYVNLAYSRSIVAFGIDRPSGYPLLLHLLSIFGRSLALVTIVQHLAGLAVGVLAYVFLVRLRISRWIAALAAAVILLDSYAIALEQYVMAETFFALALMLCAFLAVLYHDRPWAIAASGLLLAGAVTLRLAALFAIPAFLLYLVLKTRRPQAIAAGLAALTLPLVAYASLHAADGRGFGFTEAGSWVLYGRVASIADCRGADIPRETRPLCQDARVRGRRKPSWYVWSPRSPVRRLFGWDYSARDSQLLRDFDLSIVEAHPLAYVGLVARDFGRSFEPGAGDVDFALRFPTKSARPWENRQPLKQLRDTYFPSYRRSVREPAGFLRGYALVFHTQRWLMGALVLAMIAAALARLFRRRGDRGGPSVYLLLGGMAVGMLIGTVATVELNRRFLVPTVPLIVCGGVLALRDLAKIAVRLHVEQHREQRELDP
jgi:hypothetical protein